MVYLETPRLIIRDLRMSDIGTYHAIMSDAETMYYLQDIQTVTYEESCESLKHAVGDASSPVRINYFLAMELKSASEHIGDIGYEVTHTTPVGKLVHLGYFIGKEYWGKGYMTEALPELMRFAFEEDNVFRITTGCLKDNIASERVMIKCGMYKEGEYKKFEWHDGRMKDRLSYRLLKEEWLQRSQVQEN